MPSLRQGARPAAIREPTKRRAEQTHRRLRIPQGLQPESRSDPVPSIRGTTLALHGNKRAEETAGESWWPFCRCHRRVELSESCEERKQAQPRRRAIQNAQLRSQHRALFPHVAPRALLFARLAD